MGEPIRPLQHADTVAAAPISGVKPGSRRYRIRAAPHSLARTRQSIPQARSRQNALGRAPAPGQAKRRAVSVLGLVLVGIAALSSCIPARYGLSTLPSGNYPAYVTGATNGHLPASMLVDINPRCRVSGSMARPLVTMLQDAARVGVQAVDGQLLPHLPGAGGAPEEVVRRGTVQHGGPARNEQPRLGQGRRPG